jgi:hypothetical protein
MISSRKKADCKPPSTQQEAVGGPNPSKELKVRQDNALRYAETISR